jgi:hypothetical protein
MKFGIIWGTGRGSISPKRQEEHLRDHGVERISAKAMDYLRADDELVTCHLLALGADVDALAENFRKVMRSGASLRVILTSGETAKYVEWDQYPELQKIFGKAKRHENTAPGREAAAKKPRPTGPHDVKTKAQRAALKKMWDDPDTSKADIARAYNVEWTTVNRWGKAKKLNLGPKAKPLKS